MRQSILTVLLVGRMNLLPHISIITGNDYHIYFMMLYFYISNICNHIHYSNYPQRKKRKMEGRQEKSYLSC